MKGTISHHESFVKHRDTVSILVVDVVEVPVILIIWEQLTGSCEEKKPRK